MVWEDEYYGLLGKYVAFQNYRASGWRGMEWFFRANTISAGILLELSPGNNYRNHCTNTKPIISGGFTTFMGAYRDQHAEAG